jgi:Holliday junction resolvase
MKKESSIEKEIREHAIRQGFIALKLSPSNNKGIPDRLFLRHDVILFIEFKRHGENLSKIQAKRHEELKMKGFHVYVIDDVIEGRKIIDFYVT